MVMFRNDRHVNFPPPAYHPDSQSITVAMYYGGEGRNVPVAKYIGGVENAENTEASTVGADNENADEVSAGPQEDLNLGDEDDESESDFIAETDCSDDDDELFADFVDGESNDMSADAVSDSESSETDLVGSELDENRGQMMRKMVNLTQFSIRLKRVFERVQAHCGGRWLSLERPMVFAYSSWSGSKQQPLPYCICCGTEGVYRHMEWFLTVLKQDLNIVRDNEFTFIGDKQKGLIHAFHTVFPNSAHRSCVRHLHNNFKNAGFRGLAFKNALWRAARASTPGEFNMRMDEMKQLDSVAFDWFYDKPPHEWSKSHFTEVPKCDMLLNNVCESFNANILDARDKPILTMLEWLREYLMKRLQENRDKAGHTARGCALYKDMQEPGLDQDIMDALFSDLQSKVELNVVASTENSQPPILPPVLEEEVAVEEEVAPSIMTEPGPGPSQPSVQGPSMWNQLQMAHNNTPVQAEMTLMPRLKIRAPPPMTGTGLMPCFSTRPAIPVAKTIIREHGKKFVDLSTWPRTIR
ncbi:UNVERIFIED_CONTAM: hypothetical protein Slati_3264600 [Sesamum latifolium]|uniref:MULE transposase domain-containing protein n=1 Tax=Sesamum latifolium TaxID=2727402 RepID=A0AAW2V1I1_9LAMI